MFFESEYHILEVNFFLKKIKNSNLIVKGSVVEFLSYEFIPALVI